MGRRPPPSAQKNLHQYIHRLRQLLARGGHADRLTRRPAGYLLAVQPCELDLHLFEELVAGARQSASRGDLAAASASLHRAGDLWRDDPLADVRDSPPLAGAARVLEERRAAAEEERISIDFELGAGDGLIAEATALVQAYPLRERPRVLLIRTLAAAGRRGEALACYAEARALLARELGLSPSPALRRAAEEIASEPPALAHRPASRC